jgi:hypothetical protein
VSADPRAVLTSSKMGRFLWHARILDSHWYGPFEGYAWSRERAEAKAIKAYTKYRDSVDREIVSTQSREVTPWSF